MTSWYVVGGDGEEVVRWWIAKVDEEEGAMDEYEYRRGLTGLMSLKKNERRRPMIHVGAVLGKVMQVDRNWRERDAVIKDATYPNDTFRSLDFLDFALACSNNDDDNNNECNSSKSIS